MMNPDGFEMIIIDLSDREVYVPKPVQITPAEVLVFRQIFEQFPETSAGEEIAPIVKKIPGINEDNRLTHDTVTFEYEEEIMLATLLRLVKPFLTKYQTRVISEFAGKMAKNHLRGR